MALNSQKKANKRQQNRALSLTAHHTLPIEVANLFLYIWAAVFSPVEEPNLISLDVLTVLNATSLFFSKIWKGNYLDINIQLKAMS